MLSKIACLAALATLSLAEDLPAPEIYAASSSTLMVKVPPGATAMFERAETKTAVLEDLEKVAKETADAAAAAQDQVAAIEQSVANMQVSMANSADRITSVNGIDENITLVQDTLQHLEDLYSDQIADTEKAFTKELSDAHDAADLSIEETLAEITKELNAVQTDLDKNVAGALEDAADERAAMAKSNTETMETLANFEECAESGLLYNTKKKECVEADVPEEKFMNKVWHRLWTNGDGREGGYVNSRDITVEKKMDDTFLRIFYQDNMRAHGHGTHGSWNIMICDENGNGCSECREPGRLRFWRNSWHQHNWWVNDYSGGGVTGLCKKSHNRDIRKGKYKLRINIFNTRYDLYTGSNSHGNFMVDEVVSF